jgi:hypothetical protein
MTGVKLTGTGRRAQLASVLRRLAEHAAPLKNATSGRLWRYTYGGKDNDAACLHEIKA